MYTSISEIDRTVFNIKLPMGLRKQGITVQGIACEAGRGPGVYQALSGGEERPQAVQGALLCRTARAKYPSSVSRLLRTTVFLASFTSSACPAHLIDFVTPAC